MEMEKVNSKHRKPIFVYFIQMVLVFFVVLMIQQLYASIGASSLATSKFGSEALFEIIWAGFVLIVVLIFKNKYIFTQKREGYFKSFKYIMPELILSCFFFLISIVGLVNSELPIDFNAVINLLVYCLFIGIVEEFLCRGWLLNEFLERYSNNKKEIILSIVLSSFIFGIIHFLNIGETQGLFETLVQVMNATAGGVFLALVYYKTKNIWVVVTSHAIWDFSLMLSEVNSLGDCLSGVPTKAMIITNIIRGVVLTGAYLALGYWVFIKTDLYDGGKKNFHKALVPVGIVVYLIGILFINVASDNYYSCPEYGRRKIDEPYRLSYYNYGTYNVDSIGFVMKADKKKVVLQDTVSGDSIVLGEYQDNYLFVENDDTYSILIQVGDNSVLYGNYSKNDVLHDKEYLEKIKSELGSYVVTEIGGIGTLSLQNSDYMYPIIRSNIGEILYFDKNNKLYINK